MKKIIAFMLSWGIIASMIPQTVIAEEEITDITVCDEYKASLHRCYITLLNSLQTVRRPPTNRGKTNFSEITAWIRQRR